MNVRPHRIVACPRSDRRLYRLTSTGIEVRCRSCSEHPNHVTTWEEIDRMRAELEREQAEQAREERTT